MTNTNTQSLLPAGAMARLVGVKSDWLKAEADAGRVPCLKAGDRYLFNAEAVERVLAERAAQPKGGTDGK